MRVYNCAGVACRFLMYALCVIVIGLVSTLSPAKTMADEITLENVTIPSVVGTYEMPRVILRGASLSAEALSEALDAEDPRVLWGKMLQLSADEIEIPEMVLIVNSDDQDWHMIHHNVRIENLADGRAELYSVDHAYGTPAEHETAAVSRHDFNQFTDIDIALYFRSYFETGPDSGWQFRPFAATHTLQNLEMDCGGGTRLFIEELVERDIDVRFVRNPAFDFFGAFSDVDHLNPSEEDIEAAQNYFQDLLSRRSASVDATNFSLSLTFPGSAFTLSAGNLVLRAEHAHDRPSLMIDDVAVEYTVFPHSDAAGRTARIDISRLEWTDFGFASSFDTIAAVPAQTVEEAAAPGANDIVPMIGTMRISDARGSLDQQPGQSPLTFALGQLALTIDEPYARFPTNFVLAVDGLGIDLATVSSSQFLSWLHALGHDRLDLAARLEARWMEEYEVFMVNELAVEAKELASLSVLATLEGMQPHIISTIVPRLATLAVDDDVAHRMFAFADMRVGFVQAAVEDQGLVDKAVAFHAESEDLTRDQAGLQLGTVARATLPFYLGDNLLAEELASAAGDFFTKSHRLEVLLMGQWPYNRLIYAFPIAAFDPGFLENFQVETKYR